MEKKCMDAVFGEMTYKHRWVRKQDEIIFGKKYEITVAAKAFSGKPITDEQRSAYQEFTKKKSVYFDMAGTLLIEYINSNLKEMAQYQTDAGCMEDAVELSRVVTPKTLLFKQDGTMLLLLECIWDEEDGMAVQLLPEAKVGRQDLFL
ncbi:MAG: hypothetical protein LIO96_13270 [Lachnospiraceae bacterium]|nr:hypothetical protein [Lachnospiraceae bacterium]